ncbi:hypothetical protein RUM43_004649 [Polyplax serrata]|uniref:Uncharacterized protein n=1 Tax=Polyplax serrata TaxID=468196 RepID=A0AAN8SBW8_POLSC
MDKLENVNDSHSGIWTCVVMQEDFKFKWITNWINLKGEFEQAIDKCMEDYNLDPHVE